jgi:hypothetical protein
MALCGLEIGEAQRRLDAHGGRLREAMADDTRGPSA